MKRDADAILNAELSHAIASMGHTDVLMVVDAGFPIPDDAWRIDLALTRGVPRLFDVLEAVHEELVPERVLYAEDVPEMNPEMDERLRTLYEGSGAELETTAHETILEHGERAKAIVRTGDFVPWGNVVIECGTDPKDWFADESVTMPAEYERRYEEMYGESP
ncbi:D-ribose pyranase [Halomicrobium salinisoli]|uniref:D-ribose pyranase n=1 Tax=Halomicrobium salinisoli TaxID=2878391 RepID=UPI001CF0CA87|nr:D-ribose pyranase [Halomicrobium salinisoli]